MKQLFEFFFPFLHSSSKKQDVLDSSKGKSHMKSFSNFFGKFFILKFYTSISYCNLEIGNGTLDVTKRSIIHLYHLKMDNCSVQIDLYYELMMLFVHLLSCLEMSVFNKTEKVTGHRFRTDSLFLTSSRPV